MNDIYLYLFIRNDLPSMNPGKAIAHGAHAANQAVFDIRSNPDASDHLRFLLKNWEGSTSGGFGTTISLSMNKEEIIQTVNLLQECGIHSNYTVDPTYPYEIDWEIADLINHHNHEHPPIDLGNGRAMCFREETTAGYALGRRDKLKPILKNYPLVP